MRGFFILILFFSLSFCNEEQTKVKKEPVKGPLKQQKTVSQKKSAKVNAKKNEKANKATKKMRGNIMQKTEQEQKREKLVREELSKVNDYFIVHDASTLKEKEKKFVKLLKEAATIVEIINKLQINPENLKYEKIIREKGTKDDMRLYQRYQMPWCISIKDKLCNACPTLPKKEIGLYHWPKGMTDEEFKKIHEAKNSKELLSPYTIVRRDGKEGFKAIPFVKDPLFSGLIKQLAQTLNQAADYTDDESMKKFLKSRAQAFLSEDPYPYDASDYDWIALNGDWDVTVGPYEVYKNPYQIKARFEMYFGKVNKNVTDQLTKFRNNLQEMEKLVSKLVGEKIYKPRKIDKRIAIRAIDVWMASGDGRNPQGAVVAFHLPNIGKAVDEGLYKKVILVNHSNAFSDIVKKRAKLILKPELLKYVTDEASILDTTFHEFAHGFGAYDDLEITDYQGKKTTVHKGMKEFTSLMEEEKADVLGLWFAMYALKHGFINEEQLKERYVSHLMHTIGLLQYPLEGTYPRMCAVQLGFYLENGGVTYDEKTEKWGVNFDKMPEIVEKLAKKVATLQLTGNYPEAKKFIEKYVYKNKKGEYELSKLLKKPLEIVKEKFKKANIKSIAIQYRINGL